MKLKTPNAHVAPTRSLSAVAALMLALLGCGGGSHGIGPAPTDTQTDFAFGEVSGRAAISNPPVTSSTNLCVATGFSGNISILKLREFEPSLTETRIFFDAGLHGLNDIYSCAIDGSDVQRLTTDPGFDFQPSVSTTGKVAFVSNRAINDQIFMMNTDGSSQIQMTTNGGENPSIDAAGDKIAFVNADVAIVLTVATKAVTPLQIPPTGGVLRVAISPDGKTVFFDFANGLDHTIFKEPSDASSPAVQVVHLGTANVVGLACSPDGTEIAALLEGSPTTLLRIGTGSGAQITTTLTNDVYGGLSYSADGSKVVFSEASGGTAPLRALQISSGSTSTVLDPISGTNNPSWAPFIKDRTLIASAGGILGTHACGAIYAQKGFNTESVLAFDATTPSSVVITAQTPTTGSFPNLVFSVDADSIIKMAFANTTAWRGLRVIGSGTPVVTADGALVSINTVDGTVASILPFQGTRAKGAKPTVHDDGNVRIFTGNFTGVFDGSGKNLAPAGATTVRLNMTTNELSVG